MCPAITIADRGEAVLVDAFRQGFRKARLAWLSEIVLFWRPWPAENSANPVKRTGDKSFQLHGWIPVRSKYLSGQENLTGVRGLRLRIQIAFIELDMRCIPAHAIHVADCAPAGKQELCAGGSGQGGGPQTTVRGIIRACTRGMMQRFPISLSVDHSSSYH